MRHLTAGVCLVVVACLLGPASSATAHIGGLVFGVGGDQQLYLLRPRDDWSMRLLNTYTPEKRWAGATDSFGSPDWFWGTTRHVVTNEGETLGDSHLYRVFPMQGTCRQVGEYGIAQDIVELAYNESTAVLYGTDQANLYTINTTTGAATLVGSFGVPGLVFALDYDRGVDQLVAVATTFNPAKEPVSVSTYFVDTNDGSTTLLRANAGGGAVTRVTDLWYEGTTNVLYGVANAPVNQIVEVNKVSGVISRVGRIHDSHRVTGLGGANYTVEPILPITFNCTSEANAYAEAQLGGEADPQEQHDANATPTAYAEAMSYVMVEDPPGNMLEMEATMVANHQAYTDDLTAYIESDLDFTSWDDTGEGTASGSGDGHFDGVLEVGTSQDYPAGAGGVTLSIMMTAAEVLTTDDGGWDGDGPEWLLKIWDDDPNAPLVEVNTDGVVFLEVVAGQSLNVSFDYAASAWAGGGLNALHHNVSCEFATVATLIPEPATLALLGLGGLGLLARRRRAL